MRFKEQERHKRPAYSDKDGIVKRSQRGDQPHRPREAPCGRARPRGLDSRPTGVDL